MNASVAIQVLPTVTDDEEVIRIVDAVIDYIKSTGLSYYVGPCETSIEGDYDQLMEIVKNCQLSETFVKMTHGKISYSVWAIIFTVFSFAVSNVGLSTIIEYSIPMLMLIYPPAIVLIILAFAGKLFGHDRRVYVSTMVFTWAAAIFDFMKTLPGSLQESLHLDALVIFAGKFLPLFDKNLGWLLPACIGFVIGMILRASNPAKA